MSVELGILISIVGVALSVGTFFVGRTTAAKNSGKEYGVMLTDIGYIKSGVDDMKRKMEQTDNHYIDHETRIKSLEDRMNMYHHGGS
jgi:5-bromo-4-chloroindolyl phosphate hydrolysis protein